MLWHTFVLLISFTLEKLNIKCTNDFFYISYCMREMLDKVPEGDWLCEECKSAEENENQKQGDIKFYGIVITKKKWEHRISHVLGAYYGLIVQLIFRS